MTEKGILYNPTPTQIGNELYYVFGLSPIHAFMNHDKTSIDINMRT